MRVRDQRLAWMLVVGWAAFLTAGGLRGDDSADKRFLAGLRSRGLYTLAQTYAAERLAEPDLPPAEQADMAMELSLVLVDQALAAPPGQREPLWQQSADVIARFVAAHPDNPRLLTVRFQGALGLLARGELARQEADLSGGNPERLEEARTWLRTAIRALSELDEAVAAEVRRRSQPGQANPRDSTDRLSAEQLIAIQKNIQCQLARAYRNQGESYPAGSADRANSLTQALQVLEPLATLDPVHPLAWEGRLDAVLCHRLLADYATAALKLDALAALKPPPAIALRARAERLRLALAADRLTEADGILREGRAIEGRTSPDLDYAWLEAALAGWKAAEQAQDQATADAWKKQATDLVATIRSEHGPTWGRRAEMLAAGRIEARPEQGDLAMQTRAAETAYRDRRYPEALAAYDRAAAIAREKQLTDQAFDLAFLAATIEHARDRSAEAMARYRQSALEWPKNPRAAEAHLLAVHHAARLANPPTEESLTRYAALLEEHLKLWPGGPTADGVGWRLGSLREARREWPAAVAAYAGIGPGYPDYPKVVEAIAACYLAWLAEEKAAGRPTGELAGAAAAWFDSVLLGPERRLPERWSPAARSAAEGAAAVRMHYAADYAGAEAILTAALGGANDAPAEWTARIRGLLVFALAAQGRRAEATKAIEQIAQGPPEALLATLDGLSQLAASAQPAVRAELGALETRVVEQLQPRRKDLDPAGQRLFDRLHARALAHAGRSGDAARLYRRLAELNPRDGDLQEEYATWLSAQDDAALQAAALAAWREMIAKSPPESARWFRAKYGAALMHYRLGNPQQAEKIVRPLVILYPDLGGPDLKPKFLDLLQQCRGGP